MQKVYNNVIDQRLYDNGRRCEDVTTVSLPNITHPTDTVSASGMIGEVDVPNQYFVNAMELSVNHNNGTNCRYLRNPGKHMIETRIARQRYDVNKGEIAPESVKVRCTAYFVSKEPGTVERGNPLGSTEKFSVLRYEEEINGEVITLIDTMAGKMIINGKNVSSEVEKILG